MVVLFCNGSCYSPITYGLELHMKIWLPLHPGMHPYSTSQILSTNYEGQMILNSGILVL